MRRTKQGNPRHAEGIAPYVARGISIPTVSVGEHGTIVRADCRGGWDVLFDVTRSPHWTGAFWMVEGQIEPIYDGDQKSSWDECMWQPKPALIDALRCAQ